MAIPLMLALSCLAALASTAMAAEDEGRTRMAVAPSEPDPFANAPSVLHAPELERRAIAGILRPVPIVVDLPIDLARRARRVLLHYRLWGEPDWTTLELRLIGMRHSGAIPCLEISTITGKLRYYIRVHDDDGMVIATGASRASPYEVAIRHDKELSAHSARAARCPDPADCPRGLPGCPSEAVVAVACHSDSDCEGGMTCGFEGYCEATERRAHSISLGVEQAFGVVLRSGVCHISAQEQRGETCIREDGEQYLGTPVLTSVPPGFATGPTRLQLGYERLVLLDTSVGVRLGWAFRGGLEAARVPAIVPISGGIRVTHWFGTDPHGALGLRPYAMAIGGFAMHDLASSLIVRENPRAPQFQGGNALKQRVTAWRRAGDGFVGFGGGVAYGFSRAWSASIELCVLESFPINALVLAPSVGVALGL
ncbi:MAG: hypothetical protein EXR75_14500 [Myxococcales bacterium]|nr:hypothetical protein [Myxococcales bacterium]